MHQDVDKVLLETDLVISHKTDYVHYMDKPHFHDGFEIHYTLTNATKYQIDERIVSVDAGTIALFSPEEIHRVSIDRNKLYERYIILFRPIFIDEILVESPFLLDIYKKKEKKDCFQLSVEMQIRFKGILDEMLELMDSQQNKLHRLRVKIKLIELIVLLNELSEEVGNKQIGADYENSKLISEIVNYIKKNYMKEINLDLLSEKFFVSKSTIIRSFKNTLGMTPNQYLIYVRIMRSRAYLETGYTVKDVAEKVGYKDESSFIKKFKELQGISPKQYSIKLLKTKR